MSLLPVAGSFFLADDLLNGKVYTLQMKKLPFAAVHGDADVHDGGVTRFGPTAKLVPALERGRLSTVSDFADVFGFSPASVLSYVNILSDRILFPYVVRNLVYDIPEIGKRAFLPDVQKVVPSVDVDDIERAKGYGGVRPQIVNTETKELDMGEAKITGDGVLFNITPSPGASTALKNAMTDVHTVLDFRRTTSSTRRRSARRRSRTSHGSTPTRRQALRPRTTAPTITLPPKPTTDSAGRRLSRSTTTSVDDCTRCRELRKIRGESLALQGGDEADQQYSTADDGIDGVSNAIINPSDRDSMHRW